MRLCEETTTSGRVDRKGSVIRAVKLLGAHSASGKEFSPEALHRAAALAEKRAVGEGRLPFGKQRSIKSLIGWVENARVSGEGITADVYLLRSHPMTERIFEAAERRPALFAFGLTAEAKSRQEGGRTIVSEISEVFSVDLLSDSPTSRSLFEAEQSVPAFRPVRNLAELRRETRRWCDSTMSDADWFAQLERMIAEARRIAGVPAREAIERDLDRAGEYLFGSPPPRRDEFSDMLGEPEGEAERPFDELDQLLGKAPPPERTKGLVRNIT